MYFCGWFCCQRQEEKQTIILNEQVAIAELGLYRFFNYSGRLVQQGLC